MNHRTLRVPFVLLGLLVLAIAAAAIAAGAIPARTGNPKLSTPYPYLAGDDIARRMGGVFRTTAGLSPTTLIDYDRKKKTIVVEIIGSGAEADGAKREIEAFVAVIHDRIAPYAKERHGLALNDRDVTLVYYNDGDEDQPYEVARRQDGKYIVAPAHQSSGD